MKLLLDQDVYAITARHLRTQGHDVATAGERGLSQASDTEILRHASDDGRIVVTRDRDYGELVFVRCLDAGIIYLRATHSTIEAVHAELDWVLRKYSESELKSVFIVVEPGGHRLRRNPRR